MKQKKEHRKYLAAFLLTTATLVLTLVLAVLVVDPYRIFWLSDYNKKNYIPNERYNKIKHLKENPSYNGLIFGSSRANFYSPEKASELTGGNFYNLSVSAEHIKGLEMKTKWAVENLQLEYAIVAIDIDWMFLLEKPPAEGDLFRAEHPAVSGESRFKFYMKYFSLYPGEIWKTIKGNSLDKTVIMRFDVNKGQFTFDLYEKQLQENPEAYEKNKRQVNLFYEDADFRPRIKNLKTICDTLDENDVRRTVLINPLMATTQVQIPEELFLEWIGEVVGACGGVWDFSGYNDVTMNIDNFYDWSHFRQYIGDMILEKMLVDASIAPADFGVYVTSENLNEVISEKKQNFEGYEAKKN